MKKLIFIVMMMGILCSTKVFPQYEIEKLDSYYSSLFEKTYEIHVQDEGEEYKIWIDAGTLDKIVDDGGIIFNEKQHPDFILALEQAKAKYIEWKDIAVKNNVKELSKDMSHKTKGMAYFYYGDKWHFQFYVTIYFEFRIFETSSGVNYFLVVRTPKITASDNQYIDCKDFIIAFADVSEIDDFLDKISLDKTYQFLNSPKADDLFKD